MKRIFFLPLVALLALAIVSCNQGTDYDSFRTESPTEQADIDQNAIVDYLEENKINAKRTDNGIFYVIDEQGSGDTPTIDSFVTVHYHGTLLDGTVFDSSVEREEPATFALNQVIKGWQEGIPLFNEGGKGKLYIPSTLAYGPQNRNKIPANSPLIFEVEIIDVMGQAGYQEYMMKKQMEMMAKMEEQAKEDDAIIQKYIADNTLEMTKTESGLHYKIDAQGKGANPTAAATVTCHYTGMLLDGTVFDSSYNSPDGAPIQFPLNRVIPGWTEGIPLLKKGGKGTFLIPSGMAYGPRAMGDDIPANSILKFEVELVDFTEPQVK